MADPIDDIIAETLVPGATDGRSRGKPGYPVPPEVKEQDDHSGSFFGLKVPPGAADFLAVDGGEPPEKLHVTLFYRKGLSPEQQDAFVRVCQDMTQLLPITLRAGGIGRFSASPSSDGKDVLYLSVDSPELDEVRRELLRRLAVHNISPGKDHGFTPHITLKYIGRDEDIPMRRMKEPLEFQAKETVINRGAPSGPPKNGIPHVDDLGPAEFGRFVQALTSGKMEVTEKVDGACFMEFRIRGGVLEARTKSSGWMASSDNWPKRVPAFVVPRLAHENIARKAGRFLSEGETFTADVLYGPRPNTIRYDGPPTVVSHQTVHQFSTDTGWTLRPVARLSREFVPTSEALRGPREMREWLLKELADEPSRHGGEMVEGWVFRNMQTGEMAKVVDRELFTGLNRFFWSFRESLDRGQKVDETWRRGILAELRYGLAHRVAGLPSLLSPTTRKQVKEGRDLGELIVGGFKGNFLSRAAKESRAARHALRKLRERWEAQNMTLVYEVRGRRFELDETVKARTEAAFAEAGRKLDDLDRDLDLMTGFDEETQKKMLAMRALGEAGRPDQVGVTVGRFQPFHRGHAAIVRDLARRYSKVIVLVAGNRKGKDNPFSFETRAEMLLKSLPDVSSKVEVFPVEGGFVSKEVSDLISSGKTVLKPGTAFTLLVGGDRYESFRKQLASPAARTDVFDPALVDVQRLPDVTDEDAGRISGTQVRQALASGDQQAFRKLVDPHLASNEDDFEELYARLRREMGVKEMAEAPEIPRDDALTNNTLDSIGGEEGVKKILTLNSQLLKSKKGIDVSKLKSLGNGKMGIAFDMGDGKNVLKVTSDPQEAKSSNVLKAKGQNLQHVVHIYDVFRFKNTGGTEPAWGIVQEKLRPLTMDEGQDFDWLVLPYNQGDAAEAWYYEDWNSILAAVRKMIEKKHSQRYGSKKPPPIPQDARKVDPKSRTHVDPQGSTFFAKVPEAAETSSAPTGGRAALPAAKGMGAGPVEAEFKRFVEEATRFQVDKMIKDLRSVGIAFRDFHSGNLMKRGSTYVIADIGRSKVAGGEPPMLERIVQTVIEDLGALATQPGDVNPQSSSWSRARLAKPRKKSP